MKKSLLALAVLGAFAGVASAQSSVTLYGTIDLNAKYVKNDGSDRRVALSQDGINSSQLGFKGIEDLGGGLKAGFVLLSGVNADTGTSNSKFWNRRSTVSLMGNFGEIRLGRDYVPSFWNTTIFDPFGTNGLGDTSHVHQLASVQPVAVGTTYVRADNAIAYFLPSNLGGLYGQFTAAASEGAATNPGRYLGGRIGFAAGPFDVAFSASQQTVDSNNKEKAKTYDLGGSYDFGIAKLTGFYDHQTYVGYTQNWFLIGAIVPVGQGEIHAAFSRSKLENGFSNTNNQIALGYVYNLSKRTALYTNLSRISNGSGANSANLAASRESVAGGSAISALPTAGGKSTGAEFGVRHFF
jgi:predicted porin